ncbi:hypothetical protein JHN61_05225 [Streptomyces sp. MBT67]|uniref:hypothetical protein n=1 Tax=unclassified Streptomyces TaxID=2593676 RepID=UPI00190D8A0E|nr:MULTISPECIES: hypothetical protein [unclassified Streptomyces]MBK3529250.1 hypothetical protein [Streptomyces sp. MBT72]MBK3535620.1 hypothetical protein [Streptomyces sp. MBT67]
MSGSDQHPEIPEHRHENDPTGNGIVNHGPEKTPHTDPDRPPSENAGPGESGPPEPAPPASADGESTEDPDERDPGAEAPAAEAPADAGAEAPADGGADAGTESGADARTGTGADARTEAADDARTETGADAQTESVGDAGAKTRADARTEAADDAVTGTGDDTRTETATTAPGAGEAPGDGPADAPAASDDDFLATLTDLFADGRRGPAADRSGDLDEVALRRMLHGAVRDITPSEGTLDHLHRAVPARRARRRQAVVGAAAAALLIGTAVPAFVHVATSDGSSTANPAIAGHGEQAQGGNGEEPGPEEPGRRSEVPAERESEGGEGEAAPDPSPSRGEGSDPDGAVAGEKPDTPSVDYASLPVCDPGQLGVASASTDAPGADGTVYGSFRIANVSGTDCTVSSNGTVGFTALGAADSQKIVVVQHAAGDAAPGLPDPSQEPGTVLLKPAMAYEVRFAWVPTETCPTTGPSPTPTPSADGAGGPVGGGSENQSGVDPQSLYEDGGTTAEGSVAVTHTPESGAPTAQTEIPNACSGTIYRTGVLATS